MILDATSITTVMQSRFTILGLAAVCAAVVACDSNVPAEVPKVVDKPSAAITPPQRPSQPPPPPTLVPIAAWVNDNPILEAEIDKNMLHLGTLYNNLRLPVSPALRASKRRQILERIIDERLIAAAGDQPKIQQPDEPALHEYFTTVSGQKPARTRARVSTMFLRVSPPGDPATTQQKRVELESLSAKIETSGDFQKAARAHSEGPTANLGGELGWIHRKRSTPEVGDLIFGAAPNSLTSVIETPVGVQIYWVHEFAEDVNQDLEQVRDQLMENLVRKERALARGAWVASLRKAAKIRYADAYPSSDRAQKGDDAPSPPTSLHEDAQ